MSSRYFGNSFYANILETVCHKALKVARENNDRLMQKMMIKSIHLREQMRQAARVGDKNLAHALFKEHQELSFKIAKYIDKSK